MGDNTAEEKVEDKGEGANKNEINEPNTDNSKKKGDDESNNVLKGGDEILKEHLYKEPCYSPYFNEFTREGAFNLLQMRLNSNEEVARSTHISTFINEDNVEEYISNIQDFLLNSYKNNFLQLLFENINGHLHATALLITRDFSNNFRATYFNSNNVDLPDGVIARLHNELRIESYESYVTQQMYNNNCAPELIENLSDILLWNRYDQDYAVVFQNIIYEQRLIELSINNTDITILNPSANDAQDIFDYMEIFNYISDI